MSAFANLPISRKLMAAFTAVVVVIFASSAIVYDRLLVIEWAKNWRVHTADVLETLQTARDAMLDQETGVRGYLITGDEKFLEPYHRGGNAYTAAIQKIRNLTSYSPAQQSRLDELNELANKWRLGFGERAIALMAKSETREDARALEGSTAGKTAMDLIRAKVDEIDGVERDLLAKRDAVQNHAFATAYMTTILGGAASLIIATLVGVLLTRGIAAPITRMTSAMTTLSKGDTTVEVPGVNRSDEIGAMAAAVQIFKDNMIERERAQAELARVGRLTTMGELVASIAHEINQPLTGIVTSAGAGLRWLNQDDPDFDEVRDAVSSIMQDGMRAAQVIENIRALAKKSGPQLARLDINGTIQEILVLTRTELTQHNVALHTDLSTGDRTVFGDRVQLQQVMLNLIVNGIEAMSAVRDRPKVLTISSERVESGDGVLVAVKDTGAGIDPAIADRIFESLFTTKPNGMGMGLSICRSIIEAHGGRFWASPNTPHGAIFQFTLAADRREPPTPKQATSSS
jgi:C4-dicarboxylate-specific signal transduction histidine kinase